MSKPAEWMTRKVLVDEWPNIAGKAEVTEYWEAVKDGGRGDGIILIEPGGKTVSMRLVSRVIMPAGALAGGW